MILYCNNMLSLHLMCNYFYKKTMAHCNMLMFVYNLMNILVAVINFKRFRIWSEVIDSNIRWKSSNIWREHVAICKGKVHTRGSWHVIKSCMKHKGMGKHCSCLTPNQAVRWMKNRHENMDAKQCQHVICLF